MHLAYLSLTLGCVLLTKAVCIQLSKLIKVEETSSISGMYLKTVSARSFLNCVGLCEKQGTQCYAIRYNNAGQLCDLLAYGNSEHGNGRSTGTSGLQLYAKEPSCDDEWVIYESSCYLLENKPLQWFAAKQHCAEKGSYLVSITDKAEGDFVMEQMRFLGTDSGKRIWIGANNIIKDKIFRWESGENWNFTMFSRECNNRTGSNCLKASVRWNKDVEFTWCRHRCSTYFPFICEKNTYMYLN